MISNIDPTKPISGNPTTASVRDNFAVAKSEIEAIGNTTEANSTAITDILTHPFYYNNAAATMERNSAQSFAAATPAAIAHDATLTGYAGSRYSALNCPMAPFDGWYSIEFDYLPRGTAGTATVTPTVMINGADLWVLPTVSATTTFATVQRVQFQRRLTAGDYVQLKLNFSVAGTVTARSVGQYPTDASASIVRIG